MTNSRRVVLGIMIVALPACGGGTSISDAGRDAASGSAEAGRDSASAKYVTGTFTASGGSACVTGNIKGFSNDVSKDDPQCTVVEHPGDGGSPVTFASCADNNAQPPCWGSNSCSGGLGFTFLLATVTTPPAGATFTYQCTVCPPGSTC